jgi:hypothetical protein
MLGEKSNKASLALSPSSPFQKNQSVDEGNSNFKIKPLEGDNKDEKKMRKTRFAEDVEEGQGIKGGGVTVGSFGLHDEQSPKNF